MDISAILAANLALLTQALDRPGIDLEAGLQAFSADVERAVASYTGMTMTIALDDEDVSFSVHDPAMVQPATSLLIPLAAVAHTDTANTLLLYAETPGAFVDLAADLSYALGIETAALVLDAHLDTSVDTADLNGFDEHSAINQATGVLIGHGYTPESARDELHRLAALGNGNLHAAAEALLSGADKTPTDPG